MNFHGPPPVLGCGCRNLEIFSLSSYNLSSEFSQSLIAKFSWSLNVTVGFLMMNYLHHLFLVDPMANFLLAPNEVFFIFFILIKGGLLTPRISVFIISLFF